MDQLFSISGKCALVTGGSRGVGFMIAKGLIEAGARVYISSSNSNACRQTAAELSLWGFCEALPADLSSEESCRTLAEELASREDQLHILVNNAGVTLGASFEEFGVEEWDRVLNINLKAVFFLTKFLFRMLEDAASEDDPARVINIGSVDGIHIPPIENYSYTASKAAVHHLTRHLAKRLGPRITVNAIALGPFESEMTDIDLGNAMAARAPLRRIGRPEDAAGVAIFLSSRAGSFVTGTILPLDGGLVTTG
jgi:NAD(P)-dependent dehydrogenase (short-subunit alcohol dehydrogenase family)